MKKKPCTKSCYCRGRLDKIDKDNIGNFENLPLLWIKHFSKTARKFKPHWKHI